MKTLGSRRWPIPLSHCFLLSVNKDKQIDHFCGSCNGLPIATSSNMRVTFIISVGTLCGALMQAVLGNALCKDGRSVRLPSFQLFVFLSAISGFYAFFLSCNLFPSLFFPAVHFLLLSSRSVFFFSPSNAPHPMLSSSCSACTCTVEENQSAGILWVHALPWFAQLTAN